jgi:hypothetical protein
MPDTPTYRGTAANAAGSFRIASAVPLSSGEPSGRPSCHASAPVMMPRPAFTTSSRCRSAGLSWPQVVVRAVTIVLQPRLPRRQPTIWLEVLNRDPFIRLWCRHGLRPGPISQWHRPTDGVARLAAAGPLTGIDGLRGTTPPDHNCTAFAALESFCSVERRAERWPSGLPRHLPRCSIAGDKGLGARPRSARARWRHRRRAGEADDAVGDRSSRWPTRRRGKRSWIEVLANMLLGSLPRIFSWKVGGDPRQLRGSFRLEGPAALSQNSSLFRAARSCLGVCPKAGQAASARGIRRALGSLVVGQRSLPCAISGSTQPRSPWRANGAVFCARTRSRCVKFACRSRRRRARVSAAQSFSAASGQPGLPAAR